MLLLMVPTHCYCTFFNLCIKVFLISAPDPIICAGESIHESSEIEAAPEMTEHLKNYQWWPVQEVR